MIRFTCFLILNMVCISCSTVISTGTKNHHYLNHENFVWKAFQTKEYIAYYQLGSRADKNLKIVEEKISKGIHQAKKVTGISDIQIPIYFFIVDDADEFFRLTSMSHTGISYARSNTIIESYFLLGQSHEVVHLLTYQKWGNSKTWIMEGIAVYSDNHWNGKSLEKQCIQLYKENKLIPFHDLNKKRFQSFNSQIIYPQSGCIAKYLISQYGWDKFLIFWKKKNFQKVYQISEKEMETLWIKYLLKEA